MNAFTWSPLGAVAPRDLAPARLDLHYAAQPLAAAAYALLPTQADHSHSNLLWSEEHGAFVGRPLPTGARCLLDVGVLRLALLGAGGERRGEMELTGRTLAEAFAHVADALRAAGEHVPPSGLQLPTYDLPDAPVAQGEPFGTPGAAHEELRRWFRNGAGILAQASRSQLADTPVRGWPHHFDLAALLELDAGLEVGEPRTIGVGLSPGDEHYPEPYFYISPWPYPAPSRLPELPGSAHWHTEGFTAAILTGTRLTESPGIRQEERAAEVLRAAIAASRSLLGA